MPSFPKLIALLFIGASLASIGACEYAADPSYMAGYNAAPSGAGAPSTTDDPQAYQNGLAQGKRDIRNGVWKKMVQPPEVRHPQNLDRAW